MLDYLLQAPTDVVKMQIIPFLDLVSLSNLDVATMSRELRPTVLTQIFCNVEMSEEIPRRYNKTLISWLLSRHIFVKEMHFPEDTSDDVAMAVAALEKVNYINFNQCNLISNAGARNIFRACQSLFVACLNGLPWLTDDTLYELAEKHKLLTDLSICGSTLITDAAIVSLAAQCKGLAVIEMDECILLGDVSIAALSTCPLSTISIQDCPLVSEEAILSMINVTGKTLTNMNMQNNLSVTERTLLAISRFCPLLTEINVSGCLNIGDAGFIALVQNCQNMSVFMANGCSEITSTSLDVMCATMSKELQVLHLLDIPQLHDNHINRITARATQLINLGFSTSEHITDKALVCIGQKLPLLECLYMDMSPQPALVGFTALALGCKNIVFLDVSYCHNFCDFCLRAVAVHCRKLTDLRMHATTLVSDTGIGFVAEYSAELTNIDIGYTYVTTDAVTLLIDCCLKLAGINYQGFDEVPDALLQKTKERKIELMLGENDEEVEDEE